MKNLLSIGLLCLLSVSLIGADFSSVIRGENPAQWSARGAKLTTGPFGEKIISISRQDTKGASSLSYLAPVQPGIAKELRLEYRSDLANSGRDRGAWIFVVWMDPHGKGIKSEYFILNESNTWTMRTIRISPAPENANRISIQIRVQERVGTLSLKSVSLTDAPKVEKKVVQDDLLFLKSLEKITEYELVQTPGKAPFLKNPEGNLLPVYSRKDSLPASFILPEKYCENSKWYYVIQTTFHQTKQPEKKTVGIFQIGRNMHGSRTNSLCLNIWGGSSCFARMTGNVPNSVVQVVRLGMTFAPNEKNHTTLIVSSENLRHYLNGISLGDARAKSPFFWQKNDLFHVGQEDRGLSEFPGTIDRFTLGIYRKPFDLKSAGDGMFYGPGSHRMEWDLEGKLPSVTPELSLLDVTGKKVDTKLSFHSSGKKVIVILPAGLKYGWYELKLKIADSVFIRSCAFMPEKAKRGNVKDSPFAGCQGIPVEFQKQAPDEIEKLMELLAKAGIRHFRFWLRWDNVQDQNRKYDWRGLDRIVEAAEKNGINLYPILAGGNHSYQKIVANSPYYTIEGIYPPLPEWSKYLATLAKRYKGRVKEYQIFNEPDSRCNYYPFDTGKYVELLKASYPVLKGVDPNITVGLGGVCAAFAGDLRLKKTHAPDDSAWGAAEFYALNPQKYYDVVDIHRYASGFSGQLWDWHYSDMKEMKKYLASVGDDRKPIWNSETGFVNGTPGRPGGWGVANVISIEDHAARAVQWYVQSLASGISRNYWYIVVGNEAGLVKGDYSPYPAFAAYVNMVNRLTDCKFNREFELGKNIRAYQFKNANGDFLVYVWTNSGSELLALQSKDPVSVFDIWGNCMKRNAKAVRIGTIPVLLTGSSAITPENAVTVLENGIAAKGVPGTLSIELRNPSDKQVHVELFISGDGKKIGVKHVDIASNRSEVLEIPVNDTPVSLELGVKYSGGLNFSTVVEKKLNPRTALDLRNGKVAKAELVRAEQLHIGQEVRDDQNRIISKQVWKGKNDLSGVVTLSRNGARIKFVLDVTDDSVVSAPKGKPLYAYDSLELFVAPDFAKNDRIIQTVISADGAIREFSKQKLSNLTVKTERTAQGYRMSGSFDLPSKTAFGIDFSLNDCDSISAPRKSALAFVGNGENHAQSTGYAVVLIQ